MALAWARNDGVRVRVRIRIKVRVTGRDRAMVMVMVMATDRVVARARSLPRMVAQQGEVSLQAQPLLYCCRLPPD